MKGLDMVLLTSLEMGLIFSIMAMGVMLTYKTLKISDLSVEGTFPLGAFIFARLITMGMGLGSSMVWSFIGGALGGLITYILFKKFNIDALLSGILTMTALYSLNLRITGSSNVALFDQPTIFNTSNIPMTLILLAIVLVIKLFLDWFFKTEKGYLLKTTGDNQKLVRSLGQNPNKFILLGLMLANALGSLSGAIMAQYQGFADIQMGTSMIVTALASIIIGDTFFRNISKIKDTTRAIIGAIIYRAISGIAIHYGLEPGDLKAITAFIVVVFLVYNNFLVNRMGAKNDRN